MRAKVISITYSGTASIHKEIERILRKIEYWHQGSITSYRILYQDADWAFASSEDLSRGGQLLGGCVLSSNLRVGSR
jgi:hypothetical protein